MMDIEISSSHYHVIEQYAVKCLHLNQSLFFKPQEGFNLLETDDITLRAAIAIWTGCDAITGGIKGVDISCIQKICRRTYQYS